MAFKSALMILAALTLARTTVAQNTTVAPTTTAPTAITTTAGPTTTTTGPTTIATTTVAPKPPATTTVAPKPPPATTENITNTTTPVPETFMPDGAKAGDTVLMVKATFGFLVGQEIVIGPGTPGMEFNTIMGFGTMHVATPLQNNHPKGTVVTLKKQDQTTTVAPNPCAPTTTTTIVVPPCVPEVITTTKGPCDVEVKADAKYGALATGNGATMGMAGWGVAGFVGVAVAMFAMRRSSTRRPAMSRVVNEDLEYAMVEPSEPAEGLE